MLEEQLKSGTQALDLRLQESEHRALLDYLDLLTKWNRSFNLTAVRQPADMVTRHLLDSLAILEYLPDGDVADIGTGAGLPGIPLAIARPQQRFVLVDSNGKKTRFLDHVKLKLGLDNVEVVHSRVEGFTVDTPFAAVTSRAFASLGDMIDGCLHLLAADGVLLAMKGQFPADELDDVAGRLNLKDVPTLRIPGLNEDRCLVVMSKAGSEASAPSAGDISEETPCD